MPTLADPVQHSPEQRRRTAERFTRADGTITREIELPSGGSSTSSVLDRAAGDLDDAAAFEQSWMRSPERPRTVLASETIRCADLFCGVGGLSVGLEEAAWSLDMGVDHAFAADLDAGLLDCFDRNFGARQLQYEPIETIIDGELGDPATVAESRLRQQLGELDIVLAGPPCQGHSDLNNHTRRDDPRNALLLRVIRFAEICRPRQILIENVPGALRDLGGVAERARSYLGELGYEIDEGVHRAAELGVAQTRKRFFMVASLDGEPSIEAAVARGQRPLRPVMWAIEDLGFEGGDTFDTPATHSAENQRRIEYLFDNDLYDLPNPERPPCHRDKQHSYGAVYGRMHPDLPAPTITGGFGSTGQGRFVHPRLPRTLTPHEAARVQSFPDWFDFGGLKRGQLQKAIGNAVPPRMASVLIRGLLLGTTG
jgi:DNA (cytosine-5)-methyltransferase 1